MRNGVILLNSNDRRLSRSGNSLSISNLDYSRDDGIYRCRASNSRGTVLSVPINLKVAGNRNLLTVIRPSNGYLPAQSQQWQNLPAPVKALAKARSSVLSSISFDGSFGWKKGDIAIVYIPMATGSLWVVPSVDCISLPPDINILTGVWREFYT